MSADPPFLLFNLVRLFSFLVDGLTETEEVEHISFFPFLPPVVGRRSSFFFFDTGPSRRPKVAGDGRIETSRPFFPLLLLGEK